MRLKETGCVMRGDHGVRCCLVWMGLVAWVDWRVEMGVEVGGAHWMHGKWGAEHSCAHGGTNQLTRGGALLLPLEPQPFPASTAL